MKLKSSPKMNCTVFIVFVVFLNEKVILKNSTLIYDLMIKDDLERSKDLIIKSYNLTFDSIEKEDCELIRISFCYNLPYNLTSKLNLNTRINQNQILNKLTKYERLYKLNCSIFFESFICNYHLPTCSIKPLLPCNELCTSVKNDCLSILNQNNYDWPDELDCNQFDTYEKTRICFVSPNFFEKIQTTTSNSTQKNFNCLIRLKNPPNNRLTNCSKPCYFLYDEQTTSQLRDLIFVYFHLFQITDNTCHLY